MLRNSGEFFVAAEIRQTDIPHPQAWRGTKRVVTRTKRKRVTAPRFAQAFVSDLGEEEFESTSERHYVHDGDEFVRISTDVGPMSIRWAHVVAYFPAQAQQADADRADAIKRSVMQFKSLQYKGVPYLLYDDGSVQVTIGQQSYEWGNYQEFARWVNERF